MLDKKFNTNYTISVDLLLKSITGKIRGQQSLFKQASDYFESQPINLKKLSDLETDIKDVKAELDATPLFKFKPKTKLLELDKLEKALKQERQAQDQARINRLNNAINACLKILHLSEGDDAEETQLKSAKFLATVLLFSPGEGKRLAELHNGLKPAYKAVLSLRLLDKLLADEMVKNSHILAHYSSETRYDLDAPNAIGFTQSVLLPVMFAAMFQEIGLLHPKVAYILEGEHGDKDSFRVLEKAEREKVARLTFQYTQDYLQNGLGIQQAKVDTAEQKKQFLAAEEQRLRFQISLVKDANATQFGTSEIIRIPQIYTSIVLSTKREFVRSSLPSAAILINQLASKNKISTQVAKAFVSIVGQFPPGYGVVFIPKDMRGIELNHFEYAIVTGLNPKKADEPICRVVSRNLLFSEYGKTEVIDKSRNLHFDVARKKLSRIAPAKLIEIRKKLTHKFDPKKAQELIPNSWEGNRYFFLEGYQNLWNQLNQEE